ncbi:hypothetical protein ACWCW7_35235 [Nocardia tengchongensis]
MSANRRVWYQHPDGHAIASDDLIVLPDGRAVRPTPIRCPAGHIYQSAGVTVGWTACRPDEGSCNGHLVHTCRQCGGRVFQPLLKPGCSPIAFDGRES